MVFPGSAGDPYDYDASVGEYVLFTDSEGRELVLHPGKNGFNHVHDRKTGQPINVYPDMKNFNWTSGFNMRDRRVGEQAVAEGRREDAGVPGDRRRP